MPDDDELVAPPDLSPAPVAPDVGDTDETSLDAAITRALDGAAPEPDDDSGAERDERGRFKSRQPGEGGETPAADPAANPETPENAQSAPAAPVAPKWTDGHFTGWKPEQRERFNALPPDVQQLVMDRRAEDQAFYQRRESGFRQELEPVLEAVRQVEPFARSIGATPHDLMRNYAAIDYKLRYAPFGEKVQLLQRIAHEYGIPIAQPEPDPFADPLQPNGQAYPVIHDLQSQVRRLEAQIQDTSRQREAVTMAQLDSQIASFASETAADGSPKYPFFDVVKGAMATALSDGRARTLADAYAMAAKPIEDRLGSQVAERQKQAADAQAKAVAKAKRTAPIRTSGSPNGRAKSVGLDDVLGNALTQAGIT